MTIDFICEELAELLDSPCDYSPIDEKMFQDSYCESHCGKITDKECWKRYFEKVWADRKTKPNSSEKPNNCEDVYPCDTCKWDCDKDICVRCRDWNLYAPRKVEPKDEPTISKMEQVEDEPQTKRVHIVMYEPTNAEILARLDAKTEPQTEYPRCAINGTPLDECGFCEHFNCDTCKCEAQDDNHSGGATEMVEPQTETWTKEMHDAFYTFLLNVINPNELEEYIAMFESRGIATDGRSR